jgi:hypothetical protein
MKGFLIVLLIAIAPFTGHGSDGSDSTDHRYWLIPDLAKIQFAGNIGFLSGGIGYIYADEKANLDLIYGYVPKTYGGPLHTITVKNTWIPFKSLKAGEKISVDLLTAGIPLSYTLGKQFFLVTPRDQYPARYYDYSSALRIGIFAGGRVRYHFAGESCFKEAGLFYELGTYDLLLHNYIFNYGTIRFADLFNLAVGVHVKFGK